MKLNLPPYDIKTRVIDGGHTQIYDRLRAKYVALTPEEFVRQHFVNFLIAHRCYPAVYMANEVGIHHNGTQRRCDTVIYDNTATPLAIVEYKAPSVSITPAVFDQIVRYNMVLGVQWLMVSNGLRHFCCRVCSDGSYTFIRDIPIYTDLSATTQEPIPQ